MYSQAADDIDISFLLFHKSVRAALLEPVVADPDTKWQTLPQGTQKISLVRIFGLTQGFSSTQMHP